MGHIPAGAKWYLAEIVLEFQIEAEPENVVHTNVVLVRADSPEEAYARAKALGQEGEAVYTNPHGRTVRVVYRGLSDLNVVDGELEDGTELIYTREAGLSESELAGRIRPKEDLGVFRPRDTSQDGPDWDSAGRS